VTSVTPETNLVIRTNGTKNEQLLDFTIIEEFKDGKMIKAENGWGSNLILEINSADENAKIEFETFYIRGKDVT